MAETLVELVAKIKADSAELEKGLTDAEGKTEASSKKMQDSLKKVGMAMAASGAAITAALGLMGKAAIDEDINIKNLAASLKGVGVNYDSVKDSLEAVIATTQRKTGIADSEQRDLLSRLTLVTKDYDKALNLLPLALDLAAAGQMDVNAAAVYLGKAFEDLENGAERVGIRMGTTTVYFKDLEEVQQLVGGRAEELANPFNVLKGAMSDVSEEIGKNLIPLIKGVTDKIVDIAEKVQAWIKEHPELAKQITLIAGALGIFLGVAGTILILLPKLKAAWISLQLVFTASPWGAIIAGIGLLIAAGILLWQNWDKVSHFLADIWDNIKIIFATAIKWIVSTVLLPFITMIGLEIGGLLKGIGMVVGVFKKDIGNAIEGVADKFLHAKGTIAEWADSLVDSSKASKALRDVERDVQKLTETITTEFRKQADEIQASYDKQRTESQKAYDDAVEAINKEYGIGEAAKEVSETKIEAARRATEELKQSYKREQDAARDRYDSEMESIRELYSERLAILNAETDAEISALQNQIDAIDKLTAEEELALARKEEADKLATLSGVEYDKFAAEIARRELLRTRNEEKDALRDQIAGARERAENRKEQIQSEEDAALASLKTKYEAELENYKALAVAADTDLANSLVRIETDRLAAITAQKEILDETLADIKIAEEAEITALARQLERANTQVKEINLAYDALKNRYDIEIVTHRTDVYSSTGGGEGGGGGGGIVAAQHGAIIDKPTLTLMGERAPSIREAIIPENMWGEIGGGGITINFTQPVFFDREDTMNKFVDMISKGIDRKQRLRFGGAYSG